MTKIARSGSASGSGSESGGSRSGSTPKCHGSGTLQIGTGTGYVSVFDYGTIAGLAAKP